MVESFEVTWAATSSHQWDQVFLPERNATGFEHLKPKSLRAHEESKRHIDALKAWRSYAASTSPSETCIQDDDAPSVAHFTRLLEHLRKHPLGKDGVFGVAREFKCRQMMWCIAEAHRDIKRDIWSEGSGFASASIFQDARHGKLSVLFFLRERGDLGCLFRCVGVRLRCPKVRFSAAGVGPLRRRSGHLATVDLAKDFSLDALGVQAATLAAIDKFCTLRGGSPHQVKSPASSVDAALAKRVASSIEVFVSDAAADEIRAGHLLAGQTTSTILAKELPCLRVVLRDKPHASCRLVSRLWKCDPYLHDVHSKFIWEELWS